MTRRVAQVVLNDFRDSSSLLGSRLQCQADCGAPGNVVATGTEAAARGRPLVDLGSDSRVVRRCQVAGWGGSSSVGPTRSRNEDCYGRRGALFVVADGIGGVAGGAEAASATVEEVLQRGPLVTAGAALEAWSAMIRLVGENVRRTMCDAGCRDAGTTLTLVSVEPDRVVAAHVGDSRLYEFAAGKLRQRTVDHDLRNEMSALGLDLNEETEQSLRLDALVHYVGCPDPAFRVDTFSWLPMSSSRLLLCTDGVHRSLTESEIADIVGRFPPAEAARQLTWRAELAGGRDNATAVVVEL